MNKPLISICIPTYNGEEYLVQCIESCINQTFEAYEIVICDDGSVDSTNSIIETYATLNPKIKFYKNEKNLGLVGNWNKCIELSSGSWIKFVFQDDYITIDCLQKFVNEIDDNTQLIVCKRNFVLPHNPSADLINYYTNEVRTLENVTILKNKVFSSELISKMAVENICLNFIGEPSLIFFRKTIIHKVGMFNAQLKQICDLEFALRISSNYGLKYISEQLCAFRIHTNSTTSSNVTNNYYEIHYIEPLLFSYFLLFDINFKSFRDNLTIFQKLKLKFYFELKVYNAYVINVKENRNYYLFENSTILFSEVKRYKKGNLLIRLMSYYS